MGDEQQTGDTNVTVGDLDILAEGGEKVIEPWPEPTKEDEIDEQVKVELEGEKKEEKKEEDKDKDKDEKKDKEGEKEEEEKEEEEEEEKEEEEEDELEDIEDLERATFKEVKEKYPTLFKDFPSLRDAFFREQEFSKIYPTLDDAREAQGKASAMDDMEKQLMSGDPGLLLDTLHETDQAAARKVIENFLPTVYNRSKELYREVVDPILMRMVHHLDAEGTRTGNKNLKNAALLTSQVIWGELKLPTEPIKSTEVNPEVKQLQGELKTMREQQQLKFTKGVQSTVDSKLRKVIIKGLDPEEALPELVRDMIVDETAKRAGAYLLDDPQHKANMLSLWKQAGKKGFRSEDSDTLVKAYLARIRPYLSKERSKLVTKALKDLGREPKRKVKPNIGSGSSSSSSGGESTSKVPAAREVDWRKTSDLDLLEDRTVLRK